MSTWVILGCGYIGTRLVRALLADGEPVLACGRNKEHIAELERAGADAYFFDAARSRAFTYAMSSLRSPIAVYLLPPLPGFPGGEIVSRATAAALASGANRFIYLSSTAVYGEGRDGETVDEESQIALSDPDARPYLSSEGAIENARANGLDAVILRLSPVYGPNRGVRERLLGGTYRILDQGQHVYSRIHVDDVVGIIRAVVARAPVNATYCLADDRPCPQKEYAEWLSEHLETKPPTSVPSLAPGMPRRRVRNRAVSNARLKRELEYAFRYPTYREGELAIDRELGVEGKAVEQPPLVIHKLGEPDKPAQKTGFRRLTVMRTELSPGSEERISSAGETMLYLASGELVASHGEKTHSVTAGDLVEVPRLGLHVKAASEAPASLLIISSPR